MECKGFLFDLDGTLVDSLATVEQCWGRWADAHNIARDTVIDFIHGKQAITSLRHFLPNASEQQLQREFSWLEQLESQEVAGVVALPGAMNLLEQLNQYNIPWGIITSGTTPVAYARHKAAGLPHPKVFVTADQIAHGKPAPDAYLLGAKLLGLMPDECIVIEDAIAGIASGIAAGCQVIAVNTPPEALATYKVKSLNSLAQLTLTYHRQQVIINFVEYNDR